MRIDPLSDPADTDGKIARFRNYMKDFANWCSFDTLSPFSFTPVTEATE